MNHIALIVLNYKTPDLTIDTINSLKSITHHGFTYTIYIIDNGSGDGSVKRFKALFAKDPSIKILDTGSNLGYVDGNNFGIRNAQKDGCDYILVINSDVKVKPDFLSVLHDFLNNNPGYGMVGPKIYFAPGFEFHKDRYKKNEQGRVIWSYGGTIDWDNIYGSNKAIDEVDTGQFNAVNDSIDYLSGCCLLIKKDVINKVGLFDSKYFMYSEDADYSRRVINAGYKIACVPDSVIWHINSGSSGRGSIHDYFLSRNRLLFGFRYASFRTKVALFRDSLRILFSSPYLWQKKGVLDYYFGRLGKGRWS